MLSTKGLVRPPGESPPSARVIGLGVGAGVVVAAIDQGTKAVALSNLSGGERISVLGDVVGLQLAFNSGSALSFGAGFTWVFTILAGLVVLALPLLIVRATSVVGAVALGLIWGGAAGNLLDRLFASPGFGVGRVTDFLAYGNLFVGNIADIALVAGVGLALIRFLGLSGARSTPAPVDGGASA